KSSCANTNAPAFTARGVVSGCGPRGQALPGPCTPSPAAGPRRGGWAGWARSCLGPARSPGGERGEHHRPVTSTLLHPPEAHKGLPRMPDGQPVTVRECGRRGARRGPSGPGGDGQGGAQVLDFSTEPERAGSARLVVPALEAAQQLFFLALELGRPFACGPQPRGLAGGHALEHGFGLL